MCARAAAERARAAEGSLRGGSDESSCHANDEHARRASQSSRGAAGSSARRRDKARSSWCCRRIFRSSASTDAERVAAIERYGDGPAQRFLAETAEQHGVWLVGGTIPIRDGGERASSRSLLVGPDGRVAAHYDKIHLFDVDIPGRESERYSESATTLAGTRVVTAKTPLGRIGMTVCYDIRFPALFHRLSVLGTDIVVVPAAFTVPTGEVHWLPLLQARAIESLVVRRRGRAVRRARGRPQDLRSLDDSRPVGRAACGTARRVLVSFAPTSI